MPRKVPLALDSRQRGQGPTLPTFREGPRNPGNPLVAQKTMKLGDLPTGSYLSLSANRSSSSNSWRGPRGGINIHLVSNLYKHLCSYPTRVSLQYGDGYVLHP